MPVISEKRLRFEFPDDWRVTKFDDWVFYRTQFLRDMASTCSNKNCGGRLRCAKCGRTDTEGTRGVDILAIAPTSQCWHIEIKDYRQEATADFEFLAAAVAHKVKDTLAALVIARLSAVEPTERAFAGLALACRGFRIVVHLEQPPTRSRLHPPAILQANLQQKLRQLVRSIDRHAAVVSMSQPDEVVWTVQNC